MIYFLDLLNLGKVGKYSKLREIFIYSLFTIFCIFHILFVIKLDQVIKKGKKGYARKDITNWASLPLLLSLDLPRASKQKEILQMKYSGNRSLG